MLGRQDRSQEELFVACSLRDLVPEDHILRRVDKVMDLSWLRGEVEDCYCDHNGRPGIDPEPIIFSDIYQQAVIPNSKILEKADVDTRGLFPLCSHNWNIRSDIWLAYHMAYHIT